MIITYSIPELVPYIDWTYFFHAWGFSSRYAAIMDIHGCDACRAQWLAAFAEPERQKAAEAMQLFKEANRMLEQLKDNFTVKGIYRLIGANSEGDNLLLDNHLFPLLRQQTIKKDKMPFLCLSDFVRPFSTGVKDTVGLFATSIDGATDTLYQNDTYKHLLVQTLSDRLAEAAAEKLHEYIRKDAWGYAPDENLTPKELFAAKYQGIRPAVGYPSLPDQSVNFILDDLLDMGRIGIRLTENGAMHPHASVCGLMFSHPATHYFSIGKIGEDQLKDYSMRRNKSVDEMRKFLAANL